MIYLIPNFHQLCIFVFFLFFSLKIPAEKHKETCPNKSDKLPRQDIWEYEDLNRKHRLATQMKNKYQHQHEGKTATEELQLKKQLPKTPKQKHDK